MKTVGVRWVIYQKLSVGSQKMLVFTSLFSILHSTTLCPGLNTSAASSYASGNLMMHAQLVSCSKK